MPASEETPPRAWGRHISCGRRLSQDRNTPTGVGKTQYLKRYFSLLLKHPHGRGEDDCTDVAEAGHGETPPRAWGRPCSEPSSPDTNRNTPTGVGKTVVQGKHILVGRKHPHGRGEDAVPATTACTTAETPPRAWGRHSGVRKAWSAPGNTPTGVGKTLWG